MALTDGDLKKISPESIFHEEQTYYWLTVILGCHTKTLQILKSN